MTTQQLGDHTSAAAVDAAYVEELRSRLEEAEETLRAIRLGEVDALVVNGPHGPSVYTLVTADQSYRTLVEQMREAALIVSSEGTILYCNARLSTLLDRPAVSVVGDALPGLVRDDQRAFVSSLIEAALLGDASGQVDFVRADASLVPIHLSLSALRTGSFGGVAVIATDLTEQKRREKASERERLTQAVLDFTDTAIVVCDAQGRIVRWNRAAEHMCPHDSQGRSIEEALPLGVSFAALKQQVPGGAPHEAAFTTPAGDDCYVMVRARRIGNGAPEEGWWVVTLVDITARRKSEEELRVAMEIAERANQAKTQFMGMISHELRTPLSAIIGYTELLAHEVWGPLVDKQKEQIERMRTSAWHLVTVIDEILTFTRAEAGKEELHIAHTDVTEIAASVAGLLQPEADAKGLRLHTHLPPVATMTDTDPGKVRQILVNLLGNAVKFTDTGAIDLSLSADDDAVEFRVTDTGPGIPPDQLERVFEPFVQVDGSTTRAKGGTGLGLAVCRRLTHLLGAELTVQSELQRGTTFVLRLKRSMDD